MRFLIFACFLLSAAGSSQASTLYNLDMTLRFDGFNYSEATILYDRVDPESGENASYSTYVGDLSNDYMDDPEVVALLFSNLQLPVGDVIRFHLQADTSVGMPYDVTFCMIGTKTCFLPDPFKYPTLEADSFYIDIAGDDAENVFSGGTHPGDHVSYFTFGGARSPIYAEGLQIEYDTLYDNFTVLTSNFTPDDVALVATPLPAGALLLPGGLALLAGLRRRKRTGSGA